MLCALVHFVHLVHLVQHEKRKIRLCGVAIGALGYEYRMHGLSYRSYSRC